MADLGQELIREAKAGNKEGVGTLLEKGALVDAEDTTPAHNTALMSSASNGHLDVVKLLAANGADIHMRNRNGKTALQLVDSKHLPVCLFLISLGADPTEVLWNRSAPTAYAFGGGLSVHQADLGRNVNYTALKGAREAYLKGLAISQHQPAKTVASLLLSDAFADLVFVCPSGERIHAHRNIVAACSPHMNALLQGPWAENAGGGQASEVKMPQCCSAVRALLRFMYTGEADAEACTSHTMDVLDLASQHEQPELKAACADLVAETLSLLSLGRILEIAVLRDLAALEAKCIAFVETHIAELLLFEIVQFANKHDLPDLRAACERGAVVTLKTANVMPYLEDALRFDLSQLKRACLDFVERNFSKLYFSNRMPSVDEQLSMSEVVQFANKHNFPELKAACERGCIANLKAYNLVSYLDAALRHDLPTLKHACIALAGKGHRLEEWSNLVHLADKYKSPELRAACERGAIASLCAGNVESYLMTALDHKLDALEDACLAFVRKNMAQLSLPKLVEVAREFEYYRLLEACDVGAVAVLSAANAVAALVYTNALDYVEIAIINDLSLLKRACIIFVEKYMAQLSLPHFVQLADAYANPELKAACERGAVVALKTAKIKPYLEAAINLDLSLLKAACITFLEQNVVELSLPKIIQFADKHNIPELKAACQRGAIAVLSTANAVSYLEVAIHHDLSFLQAACIKKVFFPSP